MIEKLIALFEERFQQKPRLFRAPGRINLIGEHTDYNDGFVMPAAIDKSVKLAITKRSDSQAIIYAADLNEEKKFSISNTKPTEDWLTYIQGVVHGFQQKGLNPLGFNAVFSSDIPVGAGLSSSAALCSAFAFALNEMFQFGLDRLSLAKIAQQAEHQFAGVKCGLMDQYASLFGKENAVILLDCRHEQHEYFPLQLVSHSLLLIDTKVKHSLASSAYNKRREACEHAVSIIKKDHPAIKSLRDIPLSLLEQYEGKIPAEAYQRSHFIVNEISRTQAAAALLKNNSLTAFGKLMYETHEGLSKEYEVSCAESDVLVQIARQHAITGARMMGGGFGGCTINLVQNEHLESFKNEVKRLYKEAFSIEPAFYEVSLENGVHEITTI